jgi:geranylgeranyl diphosphate synthase type I
MATAREDLTDFSVLATERDRLANYLIRHMRDTLSSTPTLLSEACEHVLATPGKLLRPLLMLEACRVIGGDPERVFPAAAGTEYGHIASLVHDDIIDGDHERRGRETLQVRYDREIALITGDFLIFQTFLSFTDCMSQGASTERVLAAIRTLSVTCIQMCQGQALEATTTGDLSTTEPTYLKVIRLKTASFCRAAARIGANLGGGDDQAIAALSSFGENLGMSFQIVDDVLSYAGEPQIVGKPLSSDIANQRMTLPIIYAIQSGGEAARAKIAELFRVDPHERAASYAQLVRLLASTDAIPRARAVARRYTAAATQQLDRLPYTPSRERLRALAATFLTRDR